MLEKHELEQYFWDAPTVAHLADFAGAYGRVCCLCAPLLGRELAARGHDVRILDMDERFADLPGFRRYDVYRPEWLGETYDLIVCDPPFFNVSLSQLFGAARLLSRSDFAQPLLVCYLQRRALNICGAFAPFALEPTGYLPGYQTVQETGRNAIEFYGNLGEAQHLRLSQGR